MLRVVLALVSVVLVLLGPPSAGVRHAGWAWPVEGAPVVARGYEAPATRYGAGHRGIDLAVGVGGAVLAPADGTVAFAGQVAGRPVLALEHGGGYRSSLEPVSSTLAVGDTVVRGQPMGTVAEGGHCAGCVHFGVRLRGEYLDPRALIVGIPRAVLLPVVTVAPVAPGVVAPVGVVAPRLSALCRVMGAEPRRGCRVAPSLHHRTRRTSPVFGGACPDPATSVGLRDRSRMPVAVASPPIPVTPTPTPTDLRRISPDLLGFGDERRSVEPVADAGRGRFDTDSTEPPPYSAGLLRIRCRGVGPWRASGYARGWAAR